MNTIHKIIQSSFILFFVVSFYLSLSFFEKKDKQANNDYSIINPGVSFNKENTFSTEKWSGFTDSKINKVEKSKIYQDILDKKPIGIVPEENQNYTIRQEVYNI